MLLLSLPRSLCADAAGAEGAAGQDPHARRARNLSTAHAQGIWRR